MMYLILFSSFLLLVTSTSVANGSIFVDSNDSAARKTLVASLHSSVVKEIETTPPTPMAASALEAKAHVHGHNQHRVQNCDDTIHGIGIDWDGNDISINRTHYTCLQDPHFTGETQENVTIANELCRTAKRGYHVCLDKKITYEDRVPTGGPHRPVWVTYGEYQFMPPQRWVHAIEHGAAAFLYNPCNEPSELRLFKELAKGCLRRHVITPYINIAPGEFQIVTYGCQLQLNKIKGQEKTIISYLRRHAINEGPEFHLYEDGSYNFGLLQQARVVTDIKDSTICPPR